jgi:hypothetical protein
MKTVLPVRADIVEEVVGFLARRIRADEGLPAIVEQGRLDALLPERHHRAVGPVVAVLGEGGLIDHDAAISPTSTAN